MSYRAVFAVLKRLILLGGNLFRGRLRAPARLQQKRSLWLKQSFIKTLVNAAPLAIALGLLTIVAHATLTRSEPPLSTQSLTVERLYGGRQEQSIAQNPTPDFPLQPHPLPPTLARWHDPKAGDYFDQIEAVPVGYLVWSQFPLTVYIQPSTPTELASPFTAQRSQAWVKAVAQAVQEWNRYLPLTVVNQSDGADITVLRTDKSSLALSATPLQVEASPVTREPRPTLQLGRVRSAVTSYKVYVKSAAHNDLPESASASTPMLAHRCTIQLRPDQAPQYLQAAARHELGHALGIWGHSRSQTDVMYFSQVRQPLPISARDLNTLKRVYEQPTRLGWALVK